MIKNYTKIELPSNYAWQLLDTEIELQLSKEVGVNLIQKLVELYALGVEYYESMHSYKYLYFQKKMTNLMINPNLLKIGEKVQQKLDSPAKQQNTKVKQKQDEFEKKVLYKAGDVSESKVKDIVRCKEKEAEDFNNKVKQALGKQADNIKEKLMKRRQASQLKMSQSMIELATHSSESSLEASAVIMQKPKIKVDFTNIINENEEQDESVYDQEKNTSVVLETKDNTQEKIPKSTKPRGRTRTNTLLRTHHIIHTGSLEKSDKPEHQKRAKSLSLSPLRSQQD